MCEDYVGRTREDRGGRNPTAPGAPRRRAREAPREESPLECARSALAETLRMLVVGFHVAAGLEVVPDGKRFDEHADDLSIGMRG